MTTKAYTQFQTKVTPQSEAIPGVGQVKNNAGGFVFKLDPWKQFERFLILGSESGTFYVNAPELTADNAVNAIACIKEDGVRALNLIVGISNSGRAPKNDPALFALALAAASANAKTRTLALSVLPTVARIGTHLFHFVQYVQQFRGWGRGLRNGIANWYTSKTPIALAKQVTKYQQRDGWSHRDLLRLAHVKPTTEEYDAIFKYVTSGLDTSINAEGLQSDAVNYLTVVEVVKTLTDADMAAEMIDTFELPREVVPTQLLTSPVVWEALLPHMGLTALLRNLGTMSKVGLLKQLSAAEAVVLTKLSDVEALRKERVHPLSILVALKTYSQGRGLKSDATWTVAPRVVDALDEAFYTAFDTIVPSGKRQLLALDVSGSMSMGDIAGLPIMPSEATATMAMVTMRTEPACAVMGFADRFRDLGITPRMRLDGVMKKVSGLSFGGTDCSLPMTWALDNGLEVDAFSVYTDNETWAGKIHPVQALKKYREKTGIAAKLVVVGTDATPFTIADPSDGGMLDVVGFDTAAPAVIADFIRG